jgi:hypothetical protein
MPLLFHYHQQVWRDEEVVEKREGEGLRGGMGMKEIEREGERKNGYGEGGRGEYVEE